MRRANQSDRGLKDKQRVVVIFIAFLLAYAAMAWGSTIPRSGELFFQLYVLGETGKAEMYYPRNDSNIPLDTEVRWHIGITNSMGSPELVALKVKIGNSTLSPPDEREIVPALLPTLVEYRRVMDTNETWEFPFIWSIKESRVSGNTIDMITLEINNAIIRTSDVSAENGCNYRLIFELWSFDRYEDRYVFGWRTGQERKCAWLQLWFNLSAIAGK